MTDNKGIIWAFQNNIMRPERYFGLVEACKKNNNEYVNFRAYSDNLKAEKYHETFAKIPDIPNNNRIIFIGTIFLVHRVHEDKRWIPGVFFDLDNFNYSACFEAWGKGMLNFNCEFMTMGEFKETCYSMHPDTKRFIRPDKDLKEFTGMVVQAGDIASWDLETDTHCDNVNLDTDIIVSSPIDIPKEFRLVIVNKNVSSGSQYKQDKKLFASTELPDAVVEFAERMCEMWTPHDVFTMDIGETEDGCKIVECNCFNCSGLYLADLTKVVRDVNAYIEEKHPIN